MKIKSQQFTKEIMRQLEEYTKEVVEEMNVKAEKIAKEAAKELKATSPVANGPSGGDYAKSWTVKKLKFYNAPTRFTIHNKDHYRLTHLLEHGHAIAGGTGRAKKMPHIQAVEEKTIKAYIAATKEVIKNAR